MKQKQMLEIIKEHHPEMTTGEARIHLNNASRQFCRKTGILPRVFSFTTTKDQRYYELDDDILEVEKVVYDGKVKRRLVGRPETIDLDV
tara:strand:+ start:2270 stop:2536 length:267 start_codon:yes stop_codon:yes gene_type:complete